MSKTLFLDIWALIKKTPHTTPHFTIQYVLSALVSKPILPMIMTLYYSSNTHIFSAIPLLSLLPTRIHSSGIGIQSPALET